jgi:hypothetical protein
MIAAQHRTGHGTPTSSNLHSLICPPQTICQKSAGPGRRTASAMGWMVRLNRVGLVQLVRFLVVELIHSDLNFRDLICVLYLQ